MLFRCCAIICVVLLYYFKTGVSNEYKKVSYTSNDAIQNIFAQLLSNIVRVNEERMEAMKQITHLQDYILTKNKLRNYEDSYDSLEDDDDNRFWRAYSKSSHFH